MKERYAPELAWLIHHVVLRQDTSWCGIFRRRQKALQTDAATAAQATATGKRLSASTPPLS